MKENKNAFEALNKIITNRTGIDYNYEVLPRWMQAKQQLHYFGYVGCQ